MSPERRRAPVLGVFCKVSQAERAEALLPQARLVAPILLLRSQESRVEGGGGLVCSRA